MSENKPNERRWEEIQKKTFTKWVNSHLRKRRLVIENIQKDLSDGVVFNEFLEIISNEKMKYTKNPKLRVQKIENVTMGLDFLKKQKVHLVNISGEDIVDENLKLILGLIWTIIQKYSIEDISEEQMNAKEALLLWCQKKTQGYNGVKVDNFHYSFQDGLALCALIHRHRPDLLDFSKLKKDDMAYNLNLAFDVADRELGIPKLLDAEDMVDIRPDEKSVMTYVAQYYHVFSKYNQAEVAGRRIGKLVDLTNAIDQMKNNYLDAAQKLVDWINATTPKMQEREFDNTLEGVKNLLDDFKQYKANDKPPKAGDKQQVEALFNNIALKLRANNRPAFEPPAGLSPADIEKLWNQLGQAESDRDQALRDELQRQQKLDVLRRRFALKAGKLENWLAAKEQYLNTDEPVNSLNEAQTKLKTHDAFDEEYSSSRPRLEAIQKIAQEFVALSPPDAADIQAKSDELTSRFDGLAGPQKTKREDLERKHELEQRKEALRLEFAKQAKEYANWAKVAQNEIDDHNFGDSLEAVEGFRPTLDSQEQDKTNTSNAKKESLDKLWDELQQLGVTENRYTPLTNQNVADYHNHLLEDLAKRRAAYELELERQRNMEAKRKEFAAKAQELADNISARRAAIDSAASQGTPDEASSAVRGQYQDGAQENERLAALSSLQEEMLGLGIRENKHTKYTLPDLQGQSNKLSDRVKALLASLEDEKLMKAEYEQKAQALVDWASAASPKLKDLSFANDLAGVRAQVSEWNNYLTGEKANHDNDKFNALQLHTKIGQLLNSSGRPAYVAPAGLAPDDLNALFNQLEADENAKDAALKNELGRQELLVKLVRKFNSDSEEFEAWIAEKEAYVNSEEVVNDLDSARLRTKLLQIFIADLGNRKPALDSIRSLREEINNLKYSDIASIDARIEKLANSLNSFDAAAASKKSALDASLLEQQRRENLRVQFADEARDFVRYARDTLGGLDSTFGTTLESVSSYQSSLDANDSEVRGRADELKNKADSTAAELSAAGVSDNRHTTVTTAEIANLRSQIEEALQNRRSAYDQELARQQSNEQKRLNFASKADDFMKWIESQKAQLQALEGSPEERTSATEALYQAGAPAKEKVDELAALDAEMKAASIFDNRHTPYSLLVVQTRRSQWDTSIANFLSGLKEEKEMNEKLAALQAEHERRLRLENLKITYSKQAGDLFNFLEGATETLSDPIRCDTIAEAEELRKAFDSVASEKDARSSELDSLSKLSAELSSEGVTDFRPLSIEQVTDRWNAFQQQFDARNHALNEEKAKQEANEALRVDFANQAKAADQFINENTSYFNNVQGDLDQQLAAVQSRNPTVVAYQSSIDSVGSAGQKLDDAGVISNPHTALTYPSIKASYEALVKLAGQKESIIQKEILAKKGSSVSEEQLAEFKEVFEHFDRDKSGQLGRLEFKSCLQSLGEDLSDADVDKTVGSIGTNGKVPFDAFVKYMSEKSRDSETQDQILEAFKALAGDKAFVTEDELRRALPGEKVDYLKANMPLYNGQAGNFDYVAWAKKAFN